MRHGLRVCGRGGREEEEDAGVGACEREDAESSGGVGQLAGGCWGSGRVERCWIRLNVLRVTPAVWGESSLQ